MTQPTTVSYPRDTPQCAAGDYLLFRAADGRWKVFRVEDFVRLARLLPLRPDGGTTAAFIDEGTALDSVAPAYGGGEPYVLLTSFDGDFSSSDEAAHAVESAALRIGATGLARRLGEFPAVVTVVVHPRR